jgi:hypothetical protein
MMRENSASGFESLDATADCAPGTVKLSRDSAAIEVARSCGERVQCIEGARRDMVGIPRGIPERVSTSGQVLSTSRSRA